MKKVLKTIITVIVLALTEFSAMFAYGPNNDDFTWRDFQNWCVQHDHGQDIDCSYEKYLELAKNPQCLICPICDKEDFFIAKFFEENSFEESL